MSDTISWLWTHICLLKELRWNLLIQKIVFRRGPHKQKYTFVNQNLDLIYQRELLKDVPMLKSVQNGLRIG